MKFDKLNKKWLVGSICAVALLLGGGLVYANATNKQQEKESAQAEIALRESTIKDVEKSVIALYSNDKKEDFAKDLTNQKINDVKIEVKKIDDKKVKEKLNTELKQLEFMLETKGIIQSFLPNDILKDDVTADNVNTLGEKYDESLSYNKKITEKKKPTLEEISKQFNEIKSANDKTNLLFLDESKEQLAENVTQEDIENVENLIKVIKNEKAKSEITVNYEKAFTIYWAKEDAKTSEEKEGESKSEETTAVSETKANSGTSENTTTNTTGSTGNTGGETQGGNAPVAQGGIEGLIAQSPTASYTDQIVAVVASGASAQVYLFEKSGSQWNTVLSTGGMVGSEGVGQASEYRSATPKGSYGLSLAFGTGGNPGASLPYRQITPNSYWISNVNDPQYNTWQERPSSDSSDEHLASYSQQYQYAIALDYNGGVGGGSAFFLHVSNGAPTAGCISVPLGIMQQLITRIHGGARIINVNSEAELASY